MDFDTRCYVAALLTDGRGTKDAEEVIKQAIRNTGKYPSSIVTDGLSSYSKAMQILGIPAEHIGNVGLSKYENNNRVERLHGTVKDWSKRKRGLKNKFDQFIEEYRAYYNFIRPNNALKDKPPVKTEGKWLKALSKLKK